ncbi:MAG: ribonuclease HI [Flavobacteriales bacterium]|nr:ribonuclease HI [Flavobacteriales bacterium]
MAEITIYTDGSAKGNPGQGGYGIVIMSGKHRKEVSVGYRLTTNNRMELLAVIAALEMIKQPNNNVMIFSDSKYVIDSVEKKWVFGWQKKGFKGKKNADLWKRFLKIYPTQNVKFTWVKGHAGNVLNERVDALAVQGAENDKFLIDEAYESLNKTPLF